MAGNQGFPPPSSPPPQNPYGFTSGQPPYVPPGGGGGMPMGAPPMTQEGNGMAVAGLVLGIIALVLCFVPFLNWLLALLGIIFGAVGNGKANRIGGKGKGMAMAGLICGIIAAILGTTIVVWAWREANRQRDYYNYRYYDRYGQVEAPTPTPDHHG